MFVTFILRMVAHASSLGWIRCPRTSREPNLLASSLNSSQKSLIECCNLHQWDPSRPIRPADKIYNAKRWPLGDALFMVCL